MSAVKEECVESLWCVCEGGSAEAVVEVNEELSVLVGGVGSTADGTLQKALIH